MRTSCALWEREGQALLDGEGGGDAEAADVGVVLLIADTADRVCDAVAIGATMQVRCSRGAGDLCSLQHSPARVGEPPPLPKVNAAPVLDAAAAPSAAAAAAGASSDAAALHVSSDAAAEVSADLGADIAAHEASLRRLALLYDMPLLAQHAFRDAAKRDGVGGGSGDKQRMKTIMKQVRHPSPALRAT